MARTLLLKGAQVDALTDKLNTPLITASLIGNIPVMRVLVEFNASLYKQSVRGNHPLLTSCRDNSNPDVVDFLLEVGSPLDIRNNEGMTAFERAHHQGHPGLAGTIEKFVLGEHNKDGEVHRACRTSFTNLKEVLGCGVDPRTIATKPGEQEWTPLHYSAAYGDGAMARLLLQNGAAVDAETDRHNTCLITGALYGNLEVVKVLVQHGASMTKQSVKGNHALLTACRDGHVGVVKFLLSSGSPTDVRNNDGQTALDRARAMGHAACAEIIEKHEQKHLAAQMGAASISEPAHVTAPQSDMAGFLGKIRLAKYEAQLRELGCEEIEDLFLIEAEDLKGLGMKPIEVRRFQSALPDTDNFLGGGASAAPGIGVDPGPGNLAFLSHYKDEAAITARLLKSFLGKSLQTKKGIKNAKIFLDSDNLSDLSNLLEEVKATRNFVLMLTPGVFTRPWCLCEIYCAMQNNQHIVLLEVRTRRGGFNFAMMENFINNIETELDQGALNTIRENGVDSISTLQDYLRRVLQKIAKPLDEAAAESVMMAQIGELVAAMTF